MPRRRGPLRVVMNSAQRVSIATLTHHPINQAITSTQFENPVLTITYTKKYLLSFDTGIGYRSSSITVIQACQAEQNSVIKTNRYCESRLSQTSPMTVKFLGF